MKCSRSRGLLALYIEGDLPDSQCDPLEGHLRECDSCQDLAAELRESQTLLKSLRGDRVPEAALISVRRQVLPQIANLQGASGWMLRLERVLMSGLRQRYALSAMAVILAISAIVVPGILWRTGSESVPVAEVVLPVPVEPLPIETPPEALLVEAPELVAEVVEASVESGPEDRPGEIFVEVPTLFEPREIPVMELSTINRAEEGPAPTVVKLVTDDPNVIIYWLTDSEEGGGA
jgi:hypothetical protein